MIAESMLCHNCGLTEYLYDYANACDNPMPVEAEPMQTVCEVSTRPFDKRLESLRAEVTHVHKEVHERKTASKKYKQYI